MLNSYDLLGSNDNNNNKLTADKLKKGVCQSMRRDQRARSCSDFEEDSDDRESSCGCSSDEYSSSLSDLEEENAMKRSQRFCRSFSLGEDQQPRNEEECSSVTSDEASPAEVVESDVRTESMQMEKKKTVCEMNQTRSGLFRPQGLWLAVARCLSLPWLSISRQSKRKLAYQVDLDQSEETQASASSASTNDSSSSSSPSGDREKPKQEQEDVGGRTGRPLRQGVSRSSPRVQRARQMTDSVWASMVLDKEMFLRVELVDSGKEGDDIRYRAEWTLSERTKELADGVWISKTQKVID